MTLRVGIIGGTGAEGWPGSEEILVETPWGDVTLFRHATAKRELFFVPRHGPEHDVSPSRVEYRALAWAMRTARCAYVLATNNVGALRKGLAVGAYVVPTDFIDRTKRRHDSFFYDGEVVHVALDPPYCPTASEALVRAAKASRGVYVATEGPRFETPAEVAALAAQGGDVVGMTGYPEVSLAREAGLHYAALAFVANAAAGVGNRKSSAADLRDQFALAWPQTRRILETAIGALPMRPRCACARSQEGARLGPRPSKAFL